MRTEHGHRPFALMTALLAGVALSFMPSPHLSAQEIQLESAVLWEEGIFTMTATVSLSEWPGGMPGARYQAEQYIRGMRETLYRDALAAYPLDSSMKVMDLLLDTPALVESLDAASAQAIHTTAVLDQGMRHLSVTWRYHIYPTVISPFVTHRKPNPLPDLIGHVATAPFTGILIYADTELPVIGENRSQRIAPVLIPAVYTSEMELLLSSRMIAPDILRKWGVAGYSQTEDTTEVFRRVGANPIRILASALYGTYGADVVIPVEDAKKLIAIEQNRELLRQGRVVIVTGPRT